MTLSSLLVAIVILVAGYYLGVLRPAGLLGRSRAQEEKERRDQAAQKWLDKDDK